jgi:hypothetical protein
LIRSDRSKNSLIPMKDTNIDRFYQVYSKKSFKVDPKAKKAKHENTKESFNLKTFDKDHY